jgi:molybdopterin synthase sulfur carrier subunit
MIRVNVRYFAVLRERRGLSEEQIETSAATIGECVNQLVVEHRLGLPVSLIRVAIGTDFADDSTPLQEGMQLLLIPPVAGG